MTQPPLALVCHTTCCAAPTQDHMRYPMSSRRPGQQWCHTIIRPCGVMLAPPKVCSLLCHSGIMFGTTVPPHSTGIVSADALDLGLVGEQKMA